MDINSFTCPICKKYKSHGSPFRIGIMLQWVCVDCQKEIREKKERERRLNGM